MTERPPDYVHIQEKFNSFHTDGNMEAYEDLQAESVVKLRDLVLQFGLADGEAEHSYLDVGCRFGAGVDKWVECGFDGPSLGIDIVPGFIEMARAKRPDLDFEVGDVHQLAYSDRSWDWVMCNQTLEHAYDVERARDELLRVTKRGLYIGIPLERGIERIKNPSHHTFMHNPISWLELFKDDEFLLSWSELHDKSFDFLLLRMGKHRDDMLARMRQRLRWR